MKTKQMEQIKDEYFLEKKVNKLIENKNEKLCRNIIISTILFWLLFLSTTLSAQKQHYIISTGLGDNIINVENINKDGNIDVNFRRTTNDIVQIELYNVVGKAQIYLLDIKYTDNYEQCSQWFIYKWDKNYKQATSGTLSLRGGTIKHLLYHEILINYNGSIYHFKVMMFNGNQIDVDEITLPVTMNFFEGDNIDNKNILNWSTYAEINNDHFIIEKSINGAEYTELVKIEGEGNTNYISNYKYIDKNITRPFYYRLKQVDFDGKTTILKTIYIDFNDSKDILIQRQQIVFQDNTSKSIYTINGKLIDILKTDTIDFSQYKIGTYIVSTNKTRIIVVKTNKNIQIKKYVL
jgi:hypothetical protein